MFSSGTVAQLLALLALLPHSKKVMGSIPAWGAVGSGGQVLPRVHSAQVGYLPGLSVWSLHKWFPPLRTPTEKTCKIPSLTKDGHFTWSPGASCPLLLGGPFTAISGLPACVSCVASIYARVCSSVSCVPLKT